MKRELFWTAVLCSCLVSVGRAQTVTGSGTTNTIPQFISPTSIGDSLIVQSNGNIGIGTQNFNGKLSVTQTRDTLDSNGVQPYAVFGLVTSGLGFSAGLRGEADATSGGAVGVIGVTTASQAGGGGGTWGLTFGTSGFSFGARGDALGTTGSGVGLFGQTFSPAGLAGQFINRARGDILLGQVGAQGSEVNVFRVDGEGTVFADGGFRAHGADFAESLPVKDNPAHYAPGDLLVIDPSGERRLALSETPYSTLVAGIYSIKPGVVASQHRMDDPASGNEVPLAMVGIVPCKVTAENGPVAVGDLLVTSAMPGRAMKGTDRARMLGAVVGKALEPLREGTGVILVLVTLQ